ncbi:MAG: sulfite exporter TauE/SafE family protein [Thermosynechococcaceae cyanobacterium]
MLDLWLVMVLGFLGSFGHCIGMCGPLTAALALSQGQGPPTPWRSLVFHSLLNVGRLISYTLVGAGIGALGSVLIAGWQFAGIDSLLRQGIVIFTGLMLMGMGLRQVAPALLPKLPILHPFTQTGLHQRLNAAMLTLSAQPHGLAPLILGMTWGLIPCGFLYAAQVKAAATGDLWMGAATMLAFGLGTVPSMLGIGLSTARMSRDRQGQLFRMGGWVMLTIGLLTLLRTSAMVDYTGHAALLLLALVLIARPLGQVWPWLLTYRRALGVGGFILSLAHTAHMLDHTFAWTINAIPYLLPLQQVGAWAGIIALGGMVPLVLTSFDASVQYLGPYWRKLHLLVLPIFLLGVAHTALLGSHYLGAWDGAITSKLRTSLLILGTAGVFLVRWRRIWQMFNLENADGSSQ